MPRNYSNPTTGLSGAVSGFLDAYAENKKIKDMEEQQKIARSQNVMKAIEQAGAFRRPIWKNGEVIGLETMPENVETAMPILSSVLGGMKDEKTGNTVQDLLSGLKGPKQVAQQPAAIPVEPKTSVIPGQKPQLPPMMPLTPKEERIRRLEHHMGESPSAIGSILGVEDTATNPDVRQVPPYAGATENPAYEWTPATDVKRVADRARLAGEFGGRVLPGELAQPLFDTALKRQQNPLSMGVQLANLPEPIAAKALGLFTPEGEPDIAKLKTQDLTKELPWNVVTQAMNESGRELVANKNLMAREMARKDLAEYRAKYLDIQKKSIGMRMDKMILDRNKLSDKQVDNIANADDAIQKYDDIVDDVISGLGRGTITLDTRLQGAIAAANALPIGGVTPEFMKKHNIISQDEQNLLFKMNKMNINEVLRVAGTTFTDKFVSRMANSLIMVGSPETFIATTTALRQEALDKYNRALDYYYANKQGGIKRKEFGLTPAEKFSGGSGGSGGLTGDQKKRLEELRAKKLKGTLGK